MLRPPLLAGLILAVTCPAFAAEPSPTPSTTPTLPAPKFLQDRERISDGTKYGLPRPPAKGPEGNALDLYNDKDNIPVDFPKLGLVDPGTLTQIPDILKKDNPSGLYYWRNFNGLAYCHYRDGDRDWFGWATGANFHWVLWRSGTFWWRDDYAERWVHWDQGYWRWQGRLKDKPIFQTVLQDGFYHACSVEGTLGDNLMRTGKEEAVTEPVDKEKSALAAENKRRRRNGDPEVGE